MPVSWRRRCVSCGRESQPANNSLFNLSQVALENVHCEELQIELTAALKAKAARPSAANMAGASVCVSAASSGYGPSASASIPTSASSSTVTWAPTISHQDQGSEIDIIMAKIEQVRERNEQGLV